MYEDDELEDIPENECQCGCGRLLTLTNERFANKTCRQRAAKRRSREKARLAGPPEGVNVDAALLTRIIHDDAVLTEEQEEALGLQIQIAKRELYLRRGGVDRELQLALDHGEIFAE